MQYLPHDRHVRFDVASKHTHPMPLLLQLSPSYFRIVSILALPRPHARFTFYWCIKSNAPTLVSAAARRWCPLAARLRTRLCSCPPVDCPQAPPAPRDLKSMGQILVMQLYLLGAGVTLGASRVAPLHTLVGAVLRGTQWLVQGDSASCIQRETSHDAVKPRVCDHFFRATTLPIEWPQNWSGRKVEVSPHRQHKVSGCVRLSPLAGSDSCVSPMPKGGRTELATGQIEHSSNGCFYLRVSMSTRMLPLQWTPVRLCFASVATATSVNENRIS